MKQSKITIVLLVVLMAIAWPYALLNGDDKESKYNSYINKAVENNSHGLYQKSIAEYDKALNIYDTEVIWEKKINAYRDRYAEDSGILQEYISALKEAVNEYPQNTGFIIELAKLYVNLDDEKEAYNVLRRSIESGVTNTRLEKLMRNIKYSYDFGWSSYQDVTDFYNGYYEVYDGTNWEYVDLDGSSTKIGKFEYAGRIGKEGVYLVKNNGIYQNIDKNKIVQWKYRNDIEDSGVFADNLIPLKIDGVYGYYDISGNKQFGDYGQAGTFNNGQAAVMKDGTWFIIDTSGNKVSEDTYEDIVLQADGTHLWNKMMIVKKNGVYSFFDGEKFIGKYEDVDIITDDEMVAVCVDGVWGYVNLQGDVLIEPKFAMAKSFSNGLAAVYDGNAWGFIDTTEDIVITCSYLDTGYFNSHNNCMVKVGNDDWRLLVSKIGDR